MCFCFPRHSYVVENYPKPRLVATKKEPVHKIERVKTGKKTEWYLVEPDDVFYKADVSRKLFPCVASVVFCLFCVWYSFVQVTSLLDFLPLSCAGNSATSSPNFISIFTSTRHSLSCLLSHQQVCRVRHIRHEMPSNQEDYYYRYGITDLSGIPWSPENHTHPFTYTYMPIPPVNSRPLPTPPPYSPPQVLEPEVLVGPPSPYHRRQGHVRSCPQASWTPPTLTVPCPIHVNVTNHISPTTHVPVYHVVCQVYLSFERL
jgi:hypothetical protein